MTGRAGVYDDPLIHIVIKQIIKSIFVNHTLHSSPVCFVPSPGLEGSCVTPPSPPDWSVILKIRYWFSANIFSLCSFQSAISKVGAGQIQLNVGGWWRGGRGGWPASTTRPNWSHWVLYQNVRGRGEGPTPSTERPRLDYTLTKTGRQLRDLELLICFILCTSE